MLQEVSSVQFTIGKIDAGVAILLSPHHHTVEFPAQILPDGVKTGSILTLTIERNHEEEQKQQEEFLNLQEEIYLTFSQPPEAPVISVKSTTQTSSTIQWAPLALHTADLRSIDVYKNGIKLNLNTPKTATTAKLSGLDVNAEYEVWVVARTSAGSLESNRIMVKTHTMDNLTGINVTFGTLDNPDDIDSLLELVTEMGAKHTDDLTVENTHLVCTVPRGPKYEKAVEWNIPIVSPEFLRACIQQGKIQPATAFYVSNPTPVRSSQDR
ncbi:BRCT domain-containing protein [Phlyctochytrium arcticum]|nr:BRCT domain-containing protein [Phlyctochytrium arcticum]